MDSFARRLLLITLALEDAIGRGSWHEVDCMVVQRQKLLDRLEEIELDEASIAILETASAVEKRLLASLGDSKASAASQLKEKQLQKRAGRVYAGHARDSAWDQAG